MEFACRHKTRIINKKGIITMSKLLILISFVFFISVTTLFANGDTRGGGSGVEIGDEVLLLDLMEIDNVNNPNLLAVYDLQPITAKENSLVFGEGCNELLKKKLAQIASADKGFEWALSRALEMYSFNIVPSALEPTCDVKTVLKLPVPLYNIAVRKNKVITINKRLWDKMNDTQKAALVIHELVYGLLLSKVENRSKERVDLASNTRSIVGFLFSEKFKNDPTKITSFVSSYLPISKQFDFQKDYSKNTFSIDGGGYEVIYNPMLIVRDIDLQDGHSWGREYSRKEINKNEEWLQKSLKSWVSNLARQDGKATQFKSVINKQKVKWDNFKGEDYIQWDNIQETIKDDTFKNGIDAVWSKDPDEMIKMITAFVKTSNYYYEEY